jgi:enoyl-CoA hydratase
VVPADTMMAEAQAAATAICALGMPSVMMAKDAVNRSFEIGLTDGIAYERRLFHSLFGTEDKDEGMEAFLAKRKAEFKHR